METKDLPVGSIVAAGWNPNEMDEAKRLRLWRSIERFGLVVPLVVRRNGNGDYETIGGAQRLQVLGEMGMTTVPCLVVEVCNAEARLLSQALNHIAGEDNLGLRA
jgi:ParB family chromosome partitioning protein